MAQTILVSRCAGTRPISEQCLVHSGQPAETPACSIGERCHSTFRLAYTSVQYLSRIATTLIRMVFSFRSPLLISRPASWFLRRAPVYLRAALLCGLSASGQPALADLPEAPI